MRGKSLSLLYITVWLASTAFALVTRIEALRTQVDTTPEYPKGHNAQTCPLSSTRIILHTTPPESEAIRLPARVLSPTLMQPRAQRELTPDELSQVCQQVSTFTFESSPFLFVSTTTTSTVQPGLYVISVKANVPIKTLNIWSTAGTNNLLVQYNQWNHIGGQFQIPAPAHIQIVLTFWSSNAAGELALFSLGPPHYMGPSSHRE